MTDRPRRLCAVLWVALCAGLGALPEPAAHAAVALSQSDAGIVVKCSHQEVTIAPDNGGRIVSFLLDGTELTRLSEGGDGGLIEETHTADYPFQVLDARSAGQGAVVRLSAEAGPLRVTKEYRFSDDSPLVAVELTFENRSREPLTGVRAPAVRNLAVPSGGKGGRELFCMDRGLGTEVMPAGLFLARPDGPGPLRWIAVSDPAAKRTLGFAVLTGGCRPIPPLRTPDGWLVAGWSCPPVPPGRRLTVRVLLAPLVGFSALAELNESFASDSMPVPGATPPEARFLLLPFRPDMGEVSVTTRTYNDEGRELGLCDPLILYGLQAFHAAHGRIPWAAASAPAWLMHEVYSRGVKIGQFAVPVDGGRGTPPPIPAAPLPATEPVEGAPVSAPGSRIPVNAEAARRGFVLWRFDGVPARAEPEVLDLAVARGQQRTVFLGVRALADVRGLRFAVASGPEGGVAVPLSPAAITAWLVLDGPGGAQMVPLRELSLAEGEVAWLALTVDAAGLAAGRYDARLMAGSDGEALRLPLQLNVFDAGPVEADAFPVWYLALRADATLPDSAQAKLAACGVSALTVALLPGGNVRAAFEAAARVERRPWSFLAFCSGAGAHPPSAPLPIRMALAQPTPVWLLEAGRAVPGAVRAAADAGCRPALLCERLGALSPDMLAGLDRTAFVLVSDGCEPQKVAQMLASGLLSGEESVWLQMDLRDADWREAATGLRSAFWAAAWQGLAGAAIAGPEPFREVDRHSPIWHIVRDARQEVALWRTVHQRAQAAVDEGGGADALRCLALAEAAVGTTDGHDLVLRPEKRPFRALLRVAGRADTGGEPPVSAFEAVDRALLGAAGSLPAAGSAGPEPGQVYWDDVPLMKDGRARWAIVASDGDVAWQRGVALQDIIQRAGGPRVPLMRVFPDLKADAPLLVWLVRGSGGAGGDEWPEAVRAQLDRLQGASLAVVRPEGGPPVAVLGAEADLSAVGRGFQRQPHPYAMARQVR